MKIGIDARFYRSSTAGIGRYTRGLLRELAKIDTKNQYTVYLTPKDKAEYDQDFKNINLKIKNFNHKIVPITHYTVAEQTKFLSILNQDKHDLVHFTNFNHPILYNGKFVITIHDLTLMFYPSGRAKNSFIRRQALKLVMGSAVKKSQQVIAISKATKNDIIKYLKADEKKINVIYEGVDSTFVSEIRNSKFEIRKNLEKYNISKPFLLFLSQWRPHKGLPELVKAFEILKEKYQISHQLVLIGKQDKAFPNIIKAVNNSKYSNDIIQPGFVPEEDLPLFFQEAESFIFPSHYEGFGLPPLEAMASGTPVISSNKSCMPEILGSSAEYFDPNKPEQMADVIYKTINDKDKLKEMKQLGFDQLKKYSWKKMANQTLDIYNKVLK